MGFAAFGHRREFLLRYLNRFHGREAINISNVENNSLLTLLGDKFPKPEGGD